MAAGLGFIEFSTGDVLSAAAANGYLASQTVMVFASAAARTSAIASPQEGMFSFLKDTNATQFYDGAAWVNLDTTGMVNPMTTTGDMIYSSSGTTPARLGIGTAAQVLTVNSGATAPEWATPAAGGGMTLLSTTSLSGGTTTISSISGAYKDLIIYVKDFYHTVNTVGYVMTINSDATAANYQQFVNRGFGTTDGSYADNTTAGVEGTGYALKDSQNDNFSVIYLPDYANATTRKVINVMSGFVQNSGSAKSVMNNTCYWSGTIAAISTLGFVAYGGGTWQAGSVEIYGVK
jgi:hypothetical protein